VIYRNGFICTGVHNSLPFPVNFETQRLSLNERLSNMRWKLFFLGLLMLSLPQVTKAWHIVGGEIYYECIGNDDYIITLKVYRDCNSQGAPFDNPAAVGVYDSLGTLVTTVLMSSPAITNVPPYINNPCLTSPPNVCVEEGIYAEIVNLPPIAGGYTLVYERCCRNASINNIFLPSEQGATYATQIPGPPYHCNNSAFFTNFPPIVLCTNDTLNFDHSATDVDGDSLYYEFATPYNGGSQMNPAPNPPAPPPFPFIIWQPAYSINYPIDANPAFTIDSLTGLLTGSPTTIGQYVLTVVAKEYRNGVLLTSNRRDFQFNTAICLSATQAGIAPQSQFCNGLTFNFQHASTYTSYWLWDFGDPTTTTDSSTAPNPSYVYPDTGTYTVTLIANPGWPCADTISAQVEISEALPMDFTFGGVSCVVGNQFDFTVLSQHSPDAVFDWDFGDGTVSSDKNPSKSFNNANDYIVSLTISENNCVSTLTDTVTVFPLIEPLFRNDPVVGCAPFTYEFIDSTNTWVNVAHLWEFGDGSASTLASPVHTYNFPGVYDVRYTLTVLEGCVDTLTFVMEDMVTVEPSPTAGFTVDPPITSFFDPVVSVYDNSLGAYWVEYYMGDSSYYTTNNFEHRYFDDGNYEVMQVVGNEYGCTDTLIKTVVVKPEYLLYVPNVFTPNGDGMNEWFLPKVFGEVNYEFTIYSRWGKRLFATTSVNEGWNGSDDKGRAAPQDVYMWVVKVFDVDGNYHREEGTFTLIR